MARPKRDLKVRLGNTNLTTPLVAAAGTVGSVVDFIDTIDFSLYGAAVAKSVSVEPWEGRPTPRLAHSGSGMLNGIGIQNPGIEGWLSDVNSRIDAVDTQVWGSVVGHDVAGFVEVARRMDTSSVAAIEVNLSCPNLEGQPFALDPDMSSEVIREVRGATTKPIGAKLSPDAFPVSAVAHAVADAGADWVVMGNTVMGASIDPLTRRPLLSGLTGGYSGAPIRPISIRCVLEIASDLPELPIVGCGGVSSADHVIEYILAGATAVAMGTAHHAQQLQAADRGVGMAEEQPVATTDRQRANDLFRLVVVDWQPTVGKILPQRGPLILQIADSFAESTTRQGRALDRFAPEPEFNLLPNRFGLALSQLVTSRCALRLAAFLDRIQLLIQRDDLRAQDRFVCLGLHELAARMRIAARVNDAASRAFFNMRVRFIGVGDDGPTESRQSFVQHRVRTRQ